VPAQTRTAVGGKASWYVNRLASKRARQRNIKLEIIASIRNTDIIASNEQFDQLTKII
jgi:hypothetical protein